MLSEKKLQPKLEIQQWSFPDFVNSLNSMNLSGICVE